MLIVGFGLVSVLKNENLKAERIDYGISYSIRDVMERGWNGSQP
jgi:hypothetical protein